MRIHIITSPSSGVISFNHQHLLTGTIHKWIGPNNLHDMISLYSFSNLGGGSSTRGGLTFENGATFYITCWNAEYSRRLVKGIQMQPEMFGGLIVKEIVLEETPDLSSRNHFRLGSPIFIGKKGADHRKEYIYYTSPEAAELMKTTLETKMREAGLPDDNTLSIRFDQDYPKKKVRKIDYIKGKEAISIKANWCPVIIEGTNITKQFAWSVGVGGSTGIGFGAIK